MRRVISCSSRKITLTPGFKPKRGMQWLGAVTSSIAIIVLTSWCQHHLSWRSTSSTTQSQNISVLDAIRTLVPKRPRNRNIWKSVFQIVNNVNNCDAKYWSSMLIDNMESDSACWMMINACWPITNGTMTPMGQWSSCMLNDDSCMLNDDTCMLNDGQCIINRWLPIIKWWIPIFKR